MFELDIDDGAIWSSLDALNRDEAIFCYACWNDFLYLRSSRPTTPTPSGHGKRTSTVVTFAHRVIIRFARWMHEEPAADTAAEVLSLCRAVRDAKTMLQLTEAQQNELIACVARAEHAVSSDPLDHVGMRTEVRSMRYILIEVADGPISAFMADAAARIIGDGIGRLFS